MILADLFIDNYDRLRAVWVSSDFSEVCFEDFKL